MVTVIFPVKLIFVIFTTCAANKFQFQSSCLPADYSTAAEICNQKNGSLFSQNDLVFIKDAYTIVDKAIDEHNVIWVDLTTNESNCSVAVKTNQTNEFLLRDCSEESHYVCKIQSDDGRNIFFRDSYLPCSLNNSVDGRNMSLGLFLSTIGVCVGTFVIVIMIIAAVCWVTNRSRRPVRYAVRTESARYHRNQPQEDNATNEAASNDMNVDDIANKDTDINSVVSTDNKVNDTASKVADIKDTDSSEADDLENQ